MLSSRKQAFTLVEMLIVVVIIGILASALIPRLTGAQARARDSARQGHLNQVSTALTTYHSDKGAFPGTGGVTYQISQVSDKIVPTYIKNIPRDPQSERTVEAISLDGSNIEVTDGGTYAYAPLTRHATLKAGMVMVANSESEGNNANWVRDPNGTLPDNVNSNNINLYDGAMINQNDSTASDNTAAQEIDKTTCDDGVTLKPNGAASLSGCVAKTNPQMLYITTQ